MLPDLEKDTEDDVVRCRRVRDELWNQFPSVDAIFEFLKQEDKKRIRRTGKAAAPSKRSSQNGRSAVRNKKQITKG